MLSPRDRDRDRSLEVTEIAQNQTIAVRWENAETVFAEGSRVSRSARLTGAFGCHSSQVPQGVPQPRSAAAPAAPPIPELCHKHFTARPYPAPLAAGLDQSEQLWLGLECHILT
ncbi:hypothetical protein GCM10007382_11880 [Salinibacterium xinjiangense]|nr:hypothetical protein GCM10007382_11880 [Salinibacterium xinjiangense]